MELPISSATYRPGDAALVRALCRARMVQARTSGEEATLDGAVVVASPRHPGVRSANLASELDVAVADPSALLTAIDDHFTQLGARCLALDLTRELAGDAWPDALRQRGYKVVAKTLFLLQSPPVAEETASLQIIPARAAYAELAAFYRDVARSDFHADETLTRDLSLALVDRLDDPRMEMFAAREAGRTVAVAGVLNLGQIGVIQPAWVLADLRGRGLGRPLMRHVIDHCRRAQLEQVILDRSEGCPAIPFYERLGFHALTRYQRCVRTREPSARG
ncbi:MAG: GNAT family N-acetyltransferase [Phycisphaeraceae bacterium]|nr:GNAT family N-acetyltransferase [Phycisphaeraceae bacterium]